MSELAAKPINPGIQELFDDAPKHTSFTYGDLLIVPVATDVLTPDVDTSVWLTPTIKLYNPVMTAAMSTISEARMLITAAEAGGIGTLHAALTPAEARSEAKKVKASRGHKVENPITANPNQSVASFLDWIGNPERNFDFRFYPVTNDDSKLVGAVSRDQLQALWDRTGTQTIEGIMSSLEEIRWAADDTDIDTARDIMLKTNSSALPLVDDAGELSGMYTIKDIIHHVHGTNATLDAAGRLAVAVAIETRPELASARVDACKEFTDLFVVDSSHGNSHKAAETVGILLKEHPGVEIMGGNFVDAESAIRFKKAGAIAGKVGIGAGSICTTRLVTGMGRGMATTIYDTVTTLRKMGIDFPVVADGGIQYYGDLSKAIALGARAIMIGGLLAGTEEVPGVFTVNAQGVRETEYNGMGSTNEQLRAREARGYTSTDAGKIFAEGVPSRVESKGPAGNIFFGLHSGLANAMAGSNAATVEQFQARAVMEWASMNTVMEGHPHIANRAISTGA